MNLPPKWSWLLFILLTALGLAGIYYKYEIFFNLQFVFGSIGALLVLQFLGLRRGVAAAFLISSITYPLWNHPYFIVIMTAETLAVGLLHKRSGLGLLLADALYWLFLGIPLAILFYYGVMHLPFYNVGVTMVKGAVNGVANALVARLIYLGVGFWRKRARVSLRELIFSLLVLFLLAPSLLLLALQSRADLARTESAVHQALKLDTERIAPLVEGWLQTQLDSVEHLAWMAAMQPLPAMQLSLEQMRRTSPEFLRMGLLDRSSTTVAFSPLLDERGQSNLGVNFADRPYIPELKRTFDPMLSEVVMGRLGTPGPIVIALAPVAKDGVYSGYVTGILDLNRVRQIIELHMRAASLPDLRFALLDRNNKIIVSSNPELKTSEPFPEMGGERIDLGEGIYQWLPNRTKNISISERWKKALYVAESRIGGKADWRLILEQPLAPFQKELYERYALQLSILFALLLAGLVLAEVASRMFVRSLRQAGAVSTDIPARIAAGAEIAWPESAIVETNALLGNFRAMSEALASQYHTIQSFNTELESRIVERTRELQESEARLALIISSAELATWDWDINTGKVILNRRWCELRGYRPEEVQFRVSEWERGIHPDDLATMHGTLNEHFENRTPFFQAEYRVQCKSGQWLWILDRGRVIERDGEGKPLRMLGIEMDITARKQAEEALQASELKYRQLVEAANSVILRLDIDGSIRFINDFGARFFGYSAEELAGKNVLGTIVPETDSSGRDLALMIREICAEPEKYRSNENENSTKDGRRVWLRWENRAISDGAGNLTGILALGYDITERRKVDEALRESEARFRTLFESAEIAVFIHAEDGRLLEANRKAIADVGVESVEALRDRDFWLPPPYSKADAQRWLQKAAAEGQQRFEWQDRDRQGRLYYRDMTLKKTTLNGQPRIIAIAVDITDRKVAEAALQAKTTQLETLTRSLEERVGEEVALRLKNEQLLVQQAKLAAMGEMLGAIAHQWRQPLNTLGLCVQNINDAYAHGDLDASSLERTVQKSMDQIRHMSKTIDDFRDFFQPDKERTEFDTMRAVGDVLALFSAQLQAHNIGFLLFCRTHGRSFSAVDEILCCREKQIVGYRNEFEHVILNLIGNAKDAILARRAAGGGVPEIGRISFAFYRTDHGVVIEVGDNGGGIPEAILPRIFEPYFTTKEPTKGSGIGLYMSRIIVEEHMHGNLTAENGPEGAVFKISLPRKEDRGAV